jgi:hypothetical protein
MTEVVISTATITEVVVSTTTMTETSEYTEAS